MVRERRGKKSKSKDVDNEDLAAPETLAVPEEPKINRYLKREKSPFEVGDNKGLQVASSNAIIDKACVMDISGGSASVAGKVDEYINLLFTDYCSLDKASCADISEIKIVIIEEEAEPTVIVPEVSIEEQEEARRVEEARAARLAEEARIRAEREEAERLVREEAERIAREEAEKVAAEEAERVRIEEEEKAKVAAEEEKKRKKAEAEAKKKAEEEEKARIASEEKARKEAEEEAIRKAAEDAAYDSDKELIPVKEDPTISWEAVEEEEPLVPGVSQEPLEDLEAEAAETETESESEMTEKDRDLEWQRQRQMMRPPLVISHLKSRAVARHGIAKLTCNVTGPAIAVRWLKNGAPIEINPKKYNFFNSEGLLSLEILNVEKKDNAEYTCFVKNKNGETSTVANLTVYESVDTERPIPPTFVSIKESYNLHHDLLTLECRVRGTPKPHIQWMKDGDYIIPGDKYEQHELPDGTCKLVIQRPETEEDSGTYTCEAECNGCSDSISHNVQFEGSVENQFNRIHRYYHRDPLKPFFKTGLTDYTIASGGSIALFIETAPNCEAEWFRDRWVIDHKPPKRYIFNDGNGFFACVVNHATMDESAKYYCKVTNPYGTSQSSSYVDIINPNSVGKGQKPPTFLTRPQTEIKIRAGDPFSMSFRVQAEPKARIQWFKGAREITNVGRTIKEVFNDYVRFSVKEAKESDSGIYFIVARNKHGVDRAFCQVTVKQARTGKKDEKKIETVVETAVEPDRSEKDRN